MSRRATLPFLAITLAASLLCGPAATARTTDTYRPDAWIKLCGLSEGCTINPPPHPWKGNNRYNTTGGGQTISVKMEDGEGVRFWIALDNDGSSADTFFVQGCQGNRRFKVNRVVLGKVKRPDASATKVTNKFNGRHALVRHGGGLRGAPQVLHAQHHRADHGRGRHVPLPDDDHLGG